MADISYAVVLNKNLKLKTLDVKQIEVILDVTGVSPDSLTLQQIRDEPKHQPVFSGPPQKYQ